MKLYLQYTCWTDLRRKGLEVLFLISLLNLVAWVSPAQAQPGKNGAAAAILDNTLINRYAALATDAAAGSNTVTVTNLSGTLAPVAAGDLVLIIQMQGASISTANDATYGNVTSYNNAGNYEFKYVTSVASNTITLSCPLRQSYTAAGRAQVVWVPQYTSFTTGATLGIGSVTGMAWDGTRGGVIAIHTTGTLTLNAAITANGIGFRGGAVDNFSQTEATGPYTTMRSTVAADGGEKGEGIAGFQTTYDGLNGRYGRGAAANAGGGGNSHNAGGGGGANGANGNTWSGNGVMCSSCTGATAWTLDPAYIANGNTRTNSSGGGRGGYTFSNSNQNALTLGPANTAWLGDNRQPVGGLGGRPLTNYNPELKAFMGGGGGAGDANNGAAQGGGRGGGIVFIIANNIAGSNPITASGENALNTVSNNNDAPGGGGGGGTIIVKTYSTATLTLTANGGSGGNQPINNDEAEGPGGGGGGGAIFYNTGTPTISVTGGANGTTSSTALTEFPANGATIGATGQSGLISPYFIAFSACAADKDADGIIDAFDTDDDNDGISDFVEACGIGATSYSCLVSSFSNGSGGALDPDTDQDRDGIPNFLDATNTAGFGGGAFVNTCPDVNADGRCDAVAYIIDRDQDQLADFLDLDSDGDGIVDLVENGRGALDVNNDGKVDGSVDLDRDGLLDAVDPSMGGTAIAGLDTDGNGRLNSEDTDADGDGVPDIAESSNGVLDVNNDGKVDGTTDLDLDGINDVVDGFNNTGVGGFTAGAANNVIDSDNLNNAANDIDADNDNIADYLDLDSDADGIPDISETLNGNYDANNDGKIDSATDVDGDGLPDVVDGVNNSGAGGFTAGAAADVFDNDNLNNAANDQDWDNDGIANYTDLDSDNDAITDAAETLNNNLDANGDGRIDSAVDVDGDGLPDVTDGVNNSGAGGFTAGTANNVYDNDNLNNASNDVDADDDARPNFLDLDSDGDGAPDIVEARRGILDTNNDGMVEAAAGDTDLDGLVNAADINNGGTATGAPDLDGDAIPGFVDLDADGDGLTDALETMNGNLDANNDGRIDGTTDLDGDGLNDLVDGFNNSGVGGFVAGAANNVMDSDNFNNAANDINTDADAAPDFLDRDSDADGILDQVEAQTTAGFIAAAGADSDGDGIDNAYDATTGGTFITPVNTDGDLLPDFYDLDTDGDGVTDLIEGNDANMNGIADATPSGLDNDADGLDNTFDTDNGGTPVALQNTDGLDQRDWRDTDDDNDGIVTGTGPAGTGEDYNGNGNRADDFTQSPGPRPDYLFAPPLPVTLVSFEVRLAGAHAELKWVTESETNSAHFIIERALDGLHFEPIVQHPAAGNSTETNFYVAHDHEVAQHGVFRIWYRLVEVDREGTRTAFEARQLVLPQGAHQVAIHPNPTPDHAQLTLLNFTTSDATLSCYTSSGQLIWQQKIEISDAFTSIPLDLTALQQGLYLIVVQSAKARYTTSLLKF